MEMLVLWIRNDFGKLELHSAVPAKSPDVERLNKLNDDLMKTYPGESVIISQYIDTSEAEEVI